MAVRKIFTGCEDSTTENYELCVYEADNCVLIEIDTKDVPASYINLDLDTLEEFILELNKIRLLISRQ